MKIKAKKMKKIGFVIFLILILTAVLSSFTFAAEDDFEQSISDFPESYKPYLRELHEKYPNWEFIPFVTNLEWTDVVNGQYGEKSLVSSSSSSKIWKSHDEDDFNPSTGVFVQKDGGFVQANRFAVEYFIDPRNFLTEDGIFQFEVLEFNENYSIEMIERVLKGSFMSDAKIEYYSYNEKTDKLTTVKTNETYAEVIFEAGKTHNINPCYLASKILNELGSDGSYSSYGDHPTYPGIYNYYNIGATDGTGAIARGLLWAKGGSTNKTTYGRPWTSPRKSIIGGAQFLAEEYIAKGQYTGYLQRFNVNPNGYYKLYTHQYMTNLTGALSQGYSTYASYAALGMLDGNITFSIPVYKNMSGGNKTDGSVTVIDSKLQYGTVNSTRAALKTGPSKSYADVKNANGSKVALTPGTEVKILSKDFTDAKYYLNILACPIWYKVNVTIGGKTYQGYIDGDFVDITTTTHVPVGNMDLNFYKTNKNLFGGLISSDYRYCTVSDNDSVSFFKNGTVYVTSYCSNGSYDKVKYTVSGNNYAVDNMKVTVNESSVNVVLSENNDAQRYGFYLKDANQKFIKGGDISSNSYTFNNLKSGSKYTVYARYVPALGSVNGTFIKNEFITKPYKAENLSCSYTSEDGLVLKWDIAERCTGYKIYSYDKATGKYTRIGTVTSNKGVFVIPESHLDKKCFMVRAYSSIDGLTSQSAYSEHLDIQKELVVPSELKVTNVTTNGYVLSWNGSLTADGYRVYRYLPDIKKYVVVGDTDKTSFEISGLASSYLCAYRVRSLSGTELSGYSDALWTLTLPESPTNLSCDSYSDNSISLSWDSVSGATSYRIYDMSTEKEKLVFESSENYCTLTQLNAGERYSFSTKSVVSQRGITYESEASETVHLATAPESVDNLKASASSQGVMLTWDKVKNADFYEIFVYDEVQGKFNYYDSTDSLSSVINNIPINKEVKISVRSVISTDYGKFFSQSRELTVKMGIPEVDGIKVSAVTSDSYKISWNPQSGAAFYTIYQKDGDGYKKLISVTDSEYILTQLKPSDKNFYKITASYVLGNIVAEGDFASEFSASTTPGNVKNLGGTVYADSVKLKWDAVDDADCYNVYLYENGGYKLKATVNSNSYTLKGLKPATKNYVRVRAYIRTTACGTLKGKLDTFTFVTMTESVTSMSVTNKTADSYTLNWIKPTEGVNRYNLYRYNTSKKGYDRIAVTSDTKYTVKNLAPGTTDKYCVIPYVIKDGKTYTRGYASKNFEFSTNLDKTVGLTASDITQTGLTLSWEETENATVYRIYKYDSTKKAYLQIGKTSKNSFKVGGLSNNTKYNFKVRAVRSADGKNYYGYYSDVYSVVTG